MRMKKLIDDVRLIYKCCYLYYQDNKSQQQICNQLGISRPTVSRMLNRGKELGIVQIELKNPENVMYGKLERDIEERFQLQEVNIVPSSPLVGGSKPINSELGRGTLHYMERVLHEGDYVGVSMGFAIQNIVRTDYFISEKIPCTFIPILGGIGDSLLEIHSNYLTQRFASLFGGKCIQFFSPAVFSQKEVLQGFLQEQTIRHVTQLYKKLNLVIMGIGIPNTQNSTILRTGYVDKRILQTFTENGAVGDIALRFFDINGNMEPFDEFNSRVSGISIEELNEVPYCVGVASGPQKAAAVLGAIRGKYINVLITDIDCAQRLLEISE